MESVGASLFMTQETKHRSYVALGLMSGTSLDGVDAALIRTDGDRVLAFGPAQTFPYDAAFRAEVRTALGRTDVNAPDIVSLTSALTRYHAEAVAALLAECPCDWCDVDVLGFHGQTLHHAPDQGVTVQIGNGKELAQATGVTVVSDFRSADVAAKGQGAPLVPVFHQALVQDLANAPNHLIFDGSVAVLNLGGVGNVTLVSDDDELLAFDTGPGNALIDDWVQAQTGQSCDENGELAACGQVDEAWLSEALSNPYFMQAPPKSLDRNTFPTLKVGQLPLACGAATLTAFTVRSVAKVLEYAPKPPSLWIVCGGGRHNASIMKGLMEQVHTQVVPAETVGWNGDGLEAQAFGYLAVRTLQGQPITFPGTTGVAEPQTGGRIDRPL